MGVYNKFKMAESTIKRMKEQLQCSICLSIYSEPKQLQCNHIFCQKCLAKLVGGSLWTITCPTCRQPTTIPTNGVAGLQSAFHIQSLLEVITLGEQDASNVTVRLGKPMPRKRKLYCPSHIDREAELYCETCEQLICYKCAVQGGAHNSHKYTEVDGLCEGYLTEMKEGVAMLKKLCGEVSTQQAAIVAKIHEKAEQLHSDIENAKTQMLSELNKMVDEKISTLKAQIQDAETAQVQYSGGIEISSPFTQNPADVLSKRVAIVKQMKQTADTFRAENMKPDNEADMMFLSPKDSSVKLGQVLQCYATGEGLKKFSNGNDITIHCLTAKGEPYTDKVSLECKLAPESPLGLATPIIPKPYPDTQAFLLGASKFRTTPSQPFVKSDTGGLFGNVPCRSVVGIDSRFGGVASQPNLLGVRQPLCGAGLADSCPPVPPLTFGGVGSEPNPRIKDISMFRSGQGKFLILGGTNSTLQCVGSTSGGVPSEWRSLWRLIL